MFTTLLQFLGFVSERAVIETPLSGDDCLTRLKPRIGSGFLPGLATQPLIGSISGREVTVRRNRVMWRNDLVSNTTFTLPANAGPLRLELKSRLPVLAIGFVIVFSVIWSLIVGAFVRAPLGWFAPLAPITLVIALRAMGPSSDETVSYLCQLLEAHKADPNADAIVAS